MQHSYVLLHLGFHSLRPYCTACFKASKAHLIAELFSPSFCRQLPGRQFMTVIPCPHLKKEGMKIALFFQRLSKNANRWRSVTQKRTGQLGDKWQVPPVSVMPPTVTAFLKRSEYSRRDGLCFIWELHEFVRRAFIVSIFNKLLDKAN